MALTRGFGGRFVEFQPMSPEEMHKTMQFLLNQQAQFSVDLANVQAGLAMVEIGLETLTNRTNSIADAVIGLTGIVANVAERQEQTDRQIRDMRAELQEHAVRTDARFTQVGDHISRVGSHLNVLIETFERHLREDHGQRPS